MSGWGRREWIKEDLKNLKPEVTIMSKVNVLGNLFA